jgi:hypothetical protein
MKVRDPGCDKQSVVYIRAFQRSAPAAGNLTQYIQVRLFLVETLQYVMTGNVKQGLLLLLMELLR